MIVAVQQTRNVEGESKPSSIEAHNVCFRIERAKNDGKKFSKCF